MAESARRNRGGARPEVEALEGRMLLSRSAGGVAAMGLEYELARSWVSPQSGVVDLTVTRSPDGAGRAVVIKVGTRVILGAPVSQARRPHPQGRRALGRDASELPIAPIDGTYRLAPGQTSLTIPIKLNPKFVPAGNVQMNVVAYLPRSHYGMWGTAPSLHIVPSEDKVPPEVVSAVVSPRVVILTFSKPMDEASVEDLRNYELSGWSPGRGLPDPSHLVALEPAAYDPATRTLTLTPASPLDPANFTYSVRLVQFASASPAFQPLGRPDFRPPMDLQGNAIVGVEEGYVISGMIGLRPVT